MNDEQKAMARFLHTILTAVTRGTGVPALVVRNCRDRNGFAAWRSLCREFDPQISDRTTARHAGLLHPRWDPKQSWWPQLLAWDTAVADYEADTGEVISDRTKVSTVCRWAPPDIRQFLKVTTTDVTRDYATLRRELKRYKDRSTIYDETGAAADDPMEVDMLKGKGKGKYSLSRLPEPSQLGLRRQEA